MRSGVTAICIVFVALAHVSAADEPKLTRSDALRLIRAADPRMKPGHPGFKNGISGRMIDLDHEHDGCAVYHAYYSSSFEQRDETVGWWEIDLRTAEIWNDNDLRLANRQIERVQQAIRRRLHVTEEERSLSVSRACIKRIK